jgi:hypothetical protein
MEDSMNDRSPELHAAALAAFAEAVTAGSTAEPVALDRFRQLTSKHLSGTHIARDDAGEWKRTAP